MIPSTYYIFLILSGVKWRWHVENDDMDCVAKGEASDYHEAANAALAAHDALRRQDTEERL